MYFRAIDVVVAALATWQAIEIWHHGAIFAVVRARLECVTNRLAYLLLCPFCLSVYVALIMWLLVATSRVMLFNGCWFTSELLILVPAALSISRLANLLNDAFHSVCRTPREDHDG